MKEAQFGSANKSIFRSIFKGAWKAGKWMSLLVLIAAATALAWVLLDEYRRDLLIRSYQAPDFYLNMLSALTGSNDIAVLMNSNEVVMCFLSQRVLGNIHIENFGALSSAQVAAINSISLPSPDSDGRYWYILFLGVDKVSRIYLVNDHDVDFDFAQTSSGCLERPVKFEVLRRGSEIGGKGLLIKFSIGG